MFNQILKLHKGKLSWFDIALGSGIAIFTLIFFLFFYRRNEFVTIKIKVTNQDALRQESRLSNWSWYANRFEVGDGESDAIGRKITEIVGIERFKVAPDKDAVYLDLRVKALYDSRNKLYSARGKTLVFGTPLRFYLSKVTFDGIVTEFPGSDFQKNFKIGTAMISTLGRHVEPAIVNSVKAGDSIYNSNGTLLAEIKDVEVTPAETVVTTNSGNVLLRYNPLFKDIKVSVKVRTKTIYGETFIFDDMPLKVGETLPLNFTHISIFPMITGFSLQ